MGKARQGRRGRRDGAEGHESKHVWGREGRCWECGVQNVGALSWPLGTAPAQRFQLNKQRVCSRPAVFHSQCLSRDAHSRLTPGCGGLGPSRPICPRLVGRESGVVGVPYFLSSALGGRPGPRFSLAGSWVARWGRGACGHAPGPCGAGSHRVAT